MQEIRGFQALHPLLQEGAPASHKIFCRRDLVPSPQLTASRHIGLFHFDNYSKFGSNCPDNIIGVLGSHCLSTRRWLEKDQGPDWSTLCFSASDWKEKEKKLGSSVAQGNGNLGDLWI